MAQNKKSFVAYCDWLDSFEELSDEEAGKLVKHLFRYVNDKNPDAPDKLTKLCFIPIQQSLKRDLKKYEAYVKKQSENGAKGGRPPKPTEPKKPNALFENPNEPKKADSVSVSANGSVSDNADSKNYLKQPDLFQVFWNLYGKKEEEVKCQREWAKIDSHEYAKIIEHVPKFVQASGNFLCKPFNYLDGRRWNDEQLPNYAKESTVKPQETHEEWSRRQTAKIRNS